MVLWTLIAVLVLLAVFVVLFFKRGKKKEKLRPLAAAGFLLVIAAIVFGTSRIIGYGLIGVGVFIGIMFFLIRN